NNIPRPMWPIGPRRSAPAGPDPFSHHLSLRRAIGVSSRECIEPSLIPDRGPVRGSVGKNFSRRYGSARGLSATLVYEEEQMDRFEGKTILISGGARQQGAAESRLFVAEGARVVIGDVLEAEGRRLAGALGGAGGVVRPDGAREEDWERAIDAA